MDVRQHIGNQKKRIGIILFIPIIVFFLLVQIEVVNVFLKSLRPSIWVPTLIVFYSSFYGIMLDKIKCPNCNFKFSGLSVKVKSKHQVNVCPHCSVSLDSELNNT